jgi:hypothetical protein
MTALGAQHKNNYVMPPCARNGKQWSGGAVERWSAELIESRSQSHESHAQAQERAADVTALERFRPNRPGTFGNPASAWQRLRL